MRSEIIDSRAERKKRQFFREARGKLIPFIQTSSRKIRFCRKIGKEITFRSSFCETNKFSIYLDQNKIPLIYMKKLILTRFPKAIPLYFSKIKHCTLLTLLEKNMIYLDD